jgi:hypothetical protein
MSKSLLRLLPTALLCLFMQKLNAGPCPDSVRLNIHSVQCYGLRNGIIEVDTVFGGIRPFYFSIDGQTFSTNPVFDHLWPGTYTLYVRDDSGCIRQWPATVPEPEELVVSLSAEKDTTVAGKPFELRATVAPESIPITAIEWRPPSFFPTQDTLSQTVQISETTIFAIEIESVGGCIARDQATVTVKKTNVYIPNVIKPGSNQDAYFTVFAGEGVAKVLTMQVYSRGGGLVFERFNFEPNDPLRGWNGRWQGKYVQPGVYPWRVVVEYLDGRQESFHGDVTVMN